jgi:UPF0042 nucleotide-binding protein
MSEAGAIVVVTGLSGAGKTTALGALSDAGYYCMDNVPPQLVAVAARTCEQGGIHRIALGIDVRVGAFLDRVREAIESLPPDRFVLFLDAGDEVLVRRFSETRRPHPMLTARISALCREEAGALDLALSDAVALERAELAPIRALATAVVDSTQLSVHELRRHVLALFGQEQARMQVRVVTFGYKFGLPLDADLCFDVRFLDNPFFVPALREHAGDHPAVRDFVLGSPGAAELSDHLEALLRFCLPRYEHEGKSYLTIAVGCTGGRHRSVAFGAALAERLSRATGRRVGLLHRDLARSGIIELVSPPAPGPGGDIPRAGVGTWPAPGGPSGHAGEGERR